MVRTGAVFIFWVYVLLLWSCGRSSSHIWVRTWYNDSSGTSQAPEFIDHPSLSEVDRQILVGKNKIEFSEQKLGRTIISDSHLYKVMDLEKGQLRFVRLQSSFPPTLGAWTSEETQKIAEEGEVLYQRRGQFFEQLRRKYAQFRDIELLEAIRVIYRPQQGFFYQLRFIPSGQWLAQECDVLVTLAIDECRKISMDFEVPAWVYTLNNLEELREVLLRHVVAIRPTEIGGQQILVRSQSGIPFNPKQLPLRFEKNDPRFDQVQVYYWLDRGLEVAKQFQIHLPVPIEIETFVGFPQNTNAAFTFKNQIRLGRGDGRVYQDLAHDPSIILHELGHVFAHFLAYLPTEGQGGSINEGVADYFAAALTDSPLMGQRAYRLGPFRRNIDQVVRFDQLSNRLYQDSLLVSSLMWEIHKKIGAQKGLRLLFDTLTLLGPATEIREWGRALVRGMAFLSSEEQAFIRSIMQKRNWPEEF
ncbi:MAG: hypothetical protein NZ480_04255 [Bdellovibrionaceae bacterium]|nr:hypothetical protein [Pseudobdellovibrionaceae bacterium]MDW8190185.1 hypothetical protein [Pseudobdellovibrionaceae bacterium]